MPWFTSGTWPYKQWNKSIFDLWVLLLRAQYKSVVGNQSQTTAYGAFSNYVDPTTTWHHRLNSKRSSSDKGWTLLRMPGWTRRDDRATGVGREIFITSTTTCRLACTYFYKAWPWLPRLGYAVIKNLASDFSVSIYRIVQKHMEWFLLLNSRYSVTVDMASRVMSTWNYQLINDHGPKVLADIIRQLH